MTTLHVIYRLEERVGPGVPERWVAYSYPVSIYVDGSDLAEVRANFREAYEDLRDLLDDEYDVAEHLERPLVEGAYVRTAIDRSQLDRAETAQRFEATLTNPAQRQDFRSRAPLSATGDTVVVACVGKDRIGWLTEQMNDHDSLAVCLSTEAPLVWWTWLAGFRATFRERAQGTLADAGLTLGSTVSDFVIAEAKGTNVRHTPGLLVNEVA